MKEPGLSRERQFVDFSQIFINSFNDVIQRRLQTITEQEIHKAIEAIKQRVNSEIRDKITVTVSDNPENPETKTLHIKTDI